MTLITARGRSRPPREDEDVSDPAEHAPLGRGGPYEEGFNDDRISR